MRKFYLVIIVLILTLANCNDPVSKTTDNNTDNTFVVFDNSNGISAVIVYSSYTRSEESKITEVPAGNKSAAIKWHSGTNVPFFYTYIVTLKDINNFILSFTPDIGYDQIYPRIDANVTTNISIRSLGETVSSNEQRLSKNSYLFIQNNSSIPIELQRGSSIIPNDNLPGETVNPGERAQYTIRHSLSSFVLASSYMIRAGINSIPFSGSLVNFESGYLYSYVFDGSRLNLISEIEIILDNVTGTPDNIPVPAAPTAPIVTASDGLLTVMWTAVEKAERYEVYYSASAIPPNNPARTIPGTTTVLHGLTNKTTYNIWIKAVNSAGSGAFSPSVSGIPWPLNERPATPQLPVIIPGINNITVSWNECGGASSYEVYINTRTTPPSAPAIETSETSAVIKELEIMLFIISGYAQ